MNNADTRICVVGAGVIGLSSAVRLLQVFPSARVVLRSESFSPRTTSDVAAGIWKPHCLKDTPVHLIRRWGHATFEYMMDNIHSEVAGDMGLTLLNGNMVSTQHGTLPLDIKNEVLGFRMLDKDELEKKCGTGYKAGCEFSSPLLDNTRYLPWLLSKFEKNGGKVIQCKVVDLSELYSQYDIIVNCSGIGARGIVPDEDVTPIRGQVIKVKAPWVKNFLVVNDGEAYIIPGLDYVTLGGTFQEKVWDMDPLESDSNQIMELCCKAMPSLKHCEIIRHDVGLRPSRHSVRLECQPVRHQDRIIHVIHNYGHGGAGVTLHWGCAVDVSQLAAQALLKTEFKALKAKL